MHDHLVEDRSSCFQYFDRFVQIGKYYSDQTKTLQVSAQFFMKFGSN